jgi:hypothetical protein
VPIRTRIDEVNEYGASAKEGLAQESSAGFALEAQLEELPAGDYRRQRRSRLRVMTDEITFQLNLVADSA